MTKWELINELEVEDPEGMIEFSAEDLTWTEVAGDQVAIIPYCRLEDFIRGEQMREPAPTQFVAKIRKIKDVKDIKRTNYSTYLEYVVYRCAYGPNRVQSSNVAEPGSTTKKRLPRHSIKVGCQCHFIMRRLAIRPNDAVLIYTACRHIDDKNVVCHGNEANDMPKKFNFAPHLTQHIRTIVEDLVRDGFNATMMWEKFIFDLRYGSGELFTGAPRDSFMTRKDVSNMYNNIKRLEYVKHENDPMSVDCWVSECPRAFSSTNNKMLLKTFLSL